MMNFIRRRLKFLMWVVAAGFVGGLFFIGGRRVGPSWLASIMPASLLATMPGCARSAGIVMKIGGYNVGIQEFRRIKENTVEIARWQYKDNFDTYVENIDFDKETMEGITKYAILLQEANKQNVYVSAEEVREAIKQFPFMMPEEAGSRVKPISYYSWSVTPDGQSNPIVFRRLLETQGKITPDIFSEEVKNGLRISRLKNVVDESAMVTDLEIQQEYKKQNEKAKIKYIEIPFRDFTDKVQVNDKELSDFFQKNILDYKLDDRINISFIKIDPKDFEGKVTTSDAEVASYYKAHQEDYFEPEKVKARYILVEIASGASKEEKAKAKAYAEKILKDAKMPNADFATLAEKYSKEPFKVRHQDLGFFERGRTVKPVEDAVFALTPGSVSNVVETDYGYHIIRVEDKKSAQTKTLEEARDEIATKLREEESYVLARQKADDIQYTVMAEENIQSAVDANPDLNLSSAETGFFAKGDHIPKIGSSYAYRDLVEEAFKLKVGEISSLVEIKSYGNRVLGYFIFKLIDKKPGALPKLDEVKANVLRDLRNEKAKKLAIDEAKKIMTAFGSAGNLDELAKKNNLKVNESEPFAFSSNGYIRSEGGTIDSKFVMLKAFSMNVGEIAGPLEGRNGLYIFQLTEREKSDGKKLAQDKAEANKLRSQLLRQKHQKIYDTWYQKIRANASIRSFIPDLASS